MSYYEKKKKKKKHLVMTPTYANQCAWDSMRCGRNCTPTHGLAGIGRISGAEAQSVAIGLRRRIRGAILSLVLREGNGW
jgi:hypothetical protein